MVKNATKIVKIAKTGPAKMKNGSIQADKMHRKAKNTWTSKDECLHVCANACRGGSGPKMPNLGPKYHKNGENSINVSAKMKNGSIKTRTNA